MRSWVPDRYSLLFQGFVSILVISGCGGGSEEAAPADANAAAAAPAADTGKPATPTVKGLGASAKERQSEIDGGGQAAAEPKKEMSDLEKAQASMRAQQGGPAGPPGGQPGGGPTPGIIAPPGSGGGGPPGINFGGQPGSGGQPGAMPGREFGGAGNEVLLADNAFLENGEAMAPPGAGGLQGQGPGEQAGAAGGQAADDFSEPTKAVESFLSAIASKDAERIGRAVSRRGAEEAKNATIKKLMEGAIKKSLKAEDVDSLAKAFEEYKVVNVSLTKSSGSVNVTVGREVKSTSKKKSIVPEYERRILRVHRDGNQGWKVVDFGNRITQ